MTRPLQLFPAMLSIVVLLGCNSTPKPTPQSKIIDVFEVKLVTAAQDNAGAVAELVLIVDRPGAAISKRHYELGRVRYEQGQTKTIKVQTDKTTAWADRSQLKLFISTGSEDGYLPSMIWIAAISDQGERFTLRENAWQDKMFSTQADDPEAIPPVVAASAWEIPRGY